jgi:2,3-dimethylmalate lyase
MTESPNFNPLKEVTMTPTSLRTMIEDKPFLTCPGIFDLVSAKLVDRTGADALYMTGYGAVASYLGLPDAGLATYSQMLDCVQIIAQTVHKPLIADGDTGYCGLLNVHHTVRGYERAGAAAKPSSRISRIPRNVAIPRTGTWFRPKTWSTD